MLNRFGMPGGRIRFWSWLVISGILLGFAAADLPGIGPASVHAQADPAAANDNAEPAAAPAPAAAEPPAAEAATPAKKSGDRSLLFWMIEASGVFGLILLLLSFVMVALSVMNALQIRRDIFIPPAFVETFEQQIAKKDYQTAYDTARNDDSYLARVMTAGLGKISRGQKEAMEGMQEAGEQEAMEIEHKLSFLALIGSIAPMFGLMGTVYGMIASFRVIANSETSPKPAQLAEGISTALFTTLEGLIVAIPAMVAYLVLRNRLARLSSEVGMVSESLITQLTPSRKSSGGSSQASKE
ncbi:Biopolymer transport protein ExbB [Symmachiella macrocystis]|uniref:Biopolymer transport protein ExbB n=1 Tax=Symmachiella macrocystis TaxID=2527985 RepID=A0A5C6BJ42_9PLAN|nr:MotA/TolQ/ExbB proton channel family protein [Symmachiella macrocystis]TWU11551.1 Biopolymer transport protein ExbB [Symmachiella macrocystis]